MQGCQACLKVIDNDCPFHDFDMLLPGGEEICLKDALADCIPELLLDTVDNAVLCETCFRHLMFFYQFKQHCLEAQSKIYGYLQQVPLDTKVDMRQIAMYYRRIDAITDQKESVVHASANKLNFEEQTAIGRNSSSFTLSEIGERTTYVTSVTNNGFKVPNIKTSTAEYSSMVVEQGVILLDTDDESPPCLQDASACSTKEREAVTNIVHVQLPTKKKKRKPRSTIRIRMANGTFKTMKKRDAVALGIWDLEKRCLVENYKMLLPTL